MVTVECGWPLPTEEEEAEIFIDPRPIDWQGGVFGEPVEPEKVAEEVRRVVEAAPQWDGTAFSVFGSCAQ